MAAAHLQTEYPFYNLQHENYTFLLGWLLALRFGVVVTSSASISLVKIYMNENNVEQSVQAVH